MTQIAFSPITAPVTNNPPGTLITGVPGSGKSFFMLNLAANSLEQSARVLVLDAKNDMLALKNVFPDINTTDINKISAGALDPFVTFPDVDTATILTIVQMLCGSLSDAQLTAITPKANDFVKRARSGGSATFKDFANYLYADKNENSQNVGNRLLMNENTPHGKLLFGEVGKVRRGLSLGDKSRIISLLGLKMPSDSNSIKPDEAVDSVIIYILCKLLHDTLTRSATKQPVVLFFDECHMLMKSDAIRNEIQDILILGRSLNIGVVMASQNVTHFPSDIAQLVSSKFTFKMSKRECEEFFRMFDNTTAGQSLDVGEAIDVITRLKTGYCFMIDQKERPALIHIESNYDSGDLTSNPLFKKGR